MTPKEFAHSGYARNFDTVTIRKTRNGYVLLAGHSSRPHDNLVINCEKLDEALRLALAAFEARYHSGKGREYGQVCIFRDRGERE
jgi:hypothetical protein